MKPEGRGKPSFWKDGRGRIRSAIGTALEAGGREVYPRGTSALGASAAGVAGDWVGSDIVVWRKQGSQLLVPTISFVGRYVFLHSLLTRFRFRGVYSERYNCSLDRDRKSNRKKNIQEADLPPLPQPCHPQSPMFINAQYHPLNAPAAPPRTMHTTPNAIFWTIPTVLGGP
jgi:hypothetical protein